MTVVAVLCGLAVAVGVWLVFLSLTGTVVVGARRGDGADRPQPRKATDRRSFVFAAAGTVVALAIIVTTGLVVAGVAAGLGIYLVPKVIAAKTERDHAIAKMRAAAEFVESIRGSLGAGAGLEAAIVESALRPPAALRAELTAFAEHARLPEVTTEQALRRLADEAGEPSIDLLAGSLLAALRGAAGDMGQLFERIADQGRTFAETRAHTQAERAKVEFQTKVLSLLVIGVAIMSVLVSPDLTSAYDASPVGQLRLLIPTLIFALGWWWLTRMNQVESAHRFRLRTVEQ